MFQWLILACQFQKTRPINLWLASVCRWRRSARRQKEPRMKKWVIPFLTACPHNKKFLPDFLTLVSHFCPYKPAGIFKVITNTHRHRRWQEEVKTRDNGLLDPPFPTLFFVSRTAWISSVCPFHCSPSPSSPIPPSPFLCCHGFLNPYFSASYLAGSFA